MKSNGTVICFQKFTLTDTIGQISSIPKSPVCLGYFGRVEVKEVNTFKEYVRTASRHDAQQGCSRKQLMLYRLDRRLDSGVSISSDEYRNRGGIPFWHSESETFGLCCCTALNIASNMSGKKTSLKDVAFQIYSALEHAKADTGANYQFAITGLLDAEDLCIIVLSNRYDEISNAIGSILHLTAQDSAECIVDNSHSILMMDTAGITNIEKPGWDGVYADIHFSVKSEAGKMYLAEVVEKLKDKVPEESKEKIFMKGQTGEYDALIRCPAELLDCTMYGENGLIGYTNDRFRNAVYQSETIVYPFGNISSTHLTRPTPAKDADGDNLFEIVEDAVKKIKTYFLGDGKTEDNDFDYIELTIYRLLKDYRRMSAYPYNSDLRKDFAVQFAASVNAIVETARKCKDSDLSNSISSFNQEFDAIVNALSQSLQAASQFDRFNFDEQAYYLQNVGSYHKVLRCYYGIIKDILKLLYTVERKENSEQSLLVPLLSFGLTPIVISDKYYSKYEYDGKTVDARLISIKLPYQAIANPPKYLGILVHELFHYAAPCDRENRNRIVVTVLSKISLMEFVRMIADGLDLGYARHYGITFCKLRKVYIDSAAKCWSQEILGNEIIRCGQSDELREELPEYFNLMRDPDSLTYKIYYKLWVNLRNQLADNLADCSSEERKVFALDIEDDGEEAVISKAFEKRINALKPSALESFYNLLSDCFNAFGELPPDLFDVGFTLHGQTPDRKIAQYLWQIHGTQRDIFAGALYLRKTIDSDSTRLGITELRMGLFLDYMLEQLGQPLNSGSLSQCLGTWGGAKGRFRKIKEQFLRNYDTYSELSYLLLDDAMELSDSIAFQIQKVVRNSECREIVEKLGKFYKVYYETLDELQMEAIEEKVFNDKMFTLCCEVIDAYQEQTSLQDLCKIATSKKKAGTCGAVKLVSKDIKQVFEITAADSASLSWAINTAYKAMCGDHKIPVLWYRGQRNKNWKTLPNIMRGTDCYDNRFVNQLKNELRWARANILPVGNDFTQADWLAFLQHNGFQTNVLDFSESLYPALFFATEKWGKDAAGVPDVDASITMFNPILFNLAMTWLEQSSATHFNELKYFLEHGKQEREENIELPLFANEEDNNAYTQYFDWNDVKDSPACKPRAALIAKNCDRMKKQSGQFVFYDLRSDATEDPTTKKKRYIGWSIEELHDLYINEIAKKGITNPIPFIYKININHFAYEDFIDYLQAIGVGKYQVYPEFDKLAEDLKKQLGLNNNK